MTTAAITVLASVAQSKPGIKDAADCMWLCLARVAQDSVFLPPGLLRLAQLQHTSWHNFEALRSCLLKTTVLDSFQAHHYNYNHQRHSKQGKWDTSLIAKEQKQVGL